MKLFDKKGRDIDYTLLQKRGLLKVPKIPERNEKITSDGTLDLTAATNVLPTNASSSENVSNDLFGFLDNSLSVPSSSESSLHTPDLHALQLKLDDLEYKLDRFVEKILKIESKLEDFERKVG